MVWSDWILVTLVGVFIWNEISGQDFLPTFELDYDPRIIGE